MICTITTKQELIAIYYLLHTTLVLYNMLEHSRYPLGVVVPAGIVSGICAEARI